jgi:hypothetical protein
MKFPVRPSVICDVILNDTHHRLGCLLVRDARIIAFPSAMPNGWELESLNLVTIHEFVHLGLADAGEDYHDEGYARYAEKLIYGWLHSQLEYTVLIDQIWASNEPQKV